MKKNALGVCLTTAVLAVSALGGMSAHAADWSDTSVSYRYGTDFQEPFNGKSIAKNIINFSHASGYKYGTNFLSVDLLESNSTDDSAQEAYVVYRNTLDIGKITGKDLSFGPARGTGFTLGFDWNTKNDPGYSSRKRMLVAGPTLMMDVPGFLNFSILELWESNDPVVSYGSTTRIGRYEYKTHPMFNAAWGIPFGSSGFSFEGYFNWITAKGNDEFGGGTAPETDFDGQIMYDVGNTMGLGKNVFKVGLEYQYWHNKFGNPSSVAGSTARTPMIRAEYHF